MRPFLLGKVYTFLRHLPVFVLCRIRDENNDVECFSGAQRPGNEVRLVAGLLKNGHYFPERFLRHLPPPVNHPVDRPYGDVGHPGYVLNSDPSFHSIRFWLLSLKREGPWMVWGIQITI